MSEVKFDEARVAMDSLETKKLGVDVDSAYIQGARWQFEQDKAVIEGLQKAYHRCPCCGEEYSADQALGVEDAEG